MFTITTAKGKTFDSNYAVASPDNDGAYVTIINSDFPTVAKTFSDQNELPIDIYPQFHNVTAIVSQFTGVQLTLKP